MESLWLSKAEIAKCVAGLAKSTSFLVQENSPADALFVKPIILQFCKLYCFDTSRYVIMPDWAEISSNIFLDYIKHDDVFNSIKVLIDENGKVVTKKIGDLIYDSNYHDSIDTLSKSISLDEFMAKLFDISPAMKNKWKFAAVGSAIVTFIVDKTQEQIQYIYSESREDDSLRLRTKISLGNFLSTFDYGESHKIVTIHNRAELYQMVHRILAHEDLQAIETGVKKLKAPWLPGKQIEQKEIVLEPLQFDIMKEVNYAIALRELKDTEEKMDAETDADFNKRLIEQAIKDVDEKFQRIKTIFPTLTPHTINESKTNPYQKYFNEWPSFRDVDVNLHYFEVIDSLTKLTIRVRDNFSLVIGFAPDITRTLMELAKLQPLTKSSKIVNEYDGSGEFDVEKTIEMMQRYGEFTLAQRETVRFREKDKAKFAFILDVTGSMANEVSSICGNCCMVKEFSDQSYKLNQSQSWDVKNGLPPELDDCYFCGHEFYKSPSFRFAQFLFTIMIMIFKDFMSEALVGFINYEFDLDVQEDAFTSFTDYESLLYHVWDSYTREDSRTNYYTVGRLYADFPDFFDGYNKKFVFIITDALMEDVFYQIFKLPSKDKKVVYSDAFPYLKELSANKLINFIYCMITPHDTKDKLEVEKGLGFRKFIKQDPFSHNYSETLLRIHIKKLINEPEFKALLIDLKKLHQLALDYPDQTISQIREQISYGITPTKMKWLGKYVSLLKDQNGNVLDYKLKRVSGIDSFDILRSKAETLIQITNYPVFIDIVKTIINYDYGERWIGEEKEADGEPEEIYLKNFQSFATISDVDRLYQPSGQIPLRNSTLVAADLSPHIFPDLIYHIWLLENWDKIFVTDYFKLALTGELQRFVEIVKKRNLTDLRISRR